MFTVAQIQDAHKKVKSGADFPKYIQDIKVLGVIAFETWVYDSHTRYYGNNRYHTQSEPVYEILSISDNLDKTTFEQCLRIHQKGETDYFTFCKDCARTGIEKWIVDINRMTCTYYDKNKNEVLIEVIPR